MAAIFNDVFKCDINIKLNQLSSYDFQNDALSLYIGLSPGLAICWCKRYFSLLFPPNLTSPVYTQVSKHKLWGKLPYQVSRVKLTADYSGIEEYRYLLYQSLSALINTYV